MFHLDFQFSLFASIAPQGVLIAYAVSDIVAVSPHAEDRPVSDGLRTLGRGLPRKAMFVCHITKLVDDALQNEQVASITKVGVEPSLRCARTRVTTSSAPGAIPRQLG